MDEGNELVKSRGRQKRPGKGHANPVQTNYSNKLIPQRERERGHVMNEMYEISSRPFEF